MEERITQVKAHCLAICGEEDDYSMPALARFAEALGCDTAVVPGAGVPLPEQQPERFTELVLATIARSGAR
jgi:pimeloyl-ACP methyl ester carboxylesterase